MCRAGARSDRVACQAPEPTLEGLWLSDGYGIFAEISPTTFTPYEITAISCLPGDALAVGSHEPDGSWRLTVGENIAPRIGVDRKASA